MQNQFKLVKNNFNGVKKDKGHNDLTLYKNDNTFDDKIYNLQFCE